MIWPVLTCAVAVLLGVGVVSQLVSPPSALARSASRLAAEGDLSGARRDALRALKASPIEPAALSALGLVAEREGDAASAGRLMNAANALSRRDGTSMRWLTNYRLARRDYRGALELMDAALRRDPDQGATLHPTLAFVSADPAAQRAIAAKLREQPPWRRGMIDYLAGWQAPESTRALLLSLKNGPTPPDATEVAYYVGRLYREGRYAEARAEAMAFGPSRNDTRTVVFDGDFSGRVGVAPFNWVIGADPGAPAAIEAWPDRPGDKSLHVQHDGFSRAGFASQTIASPPGEQVFSGEVVAIPADLAEGLHWVVICAESGDQILKARVNGGPEPRRFAVRFTVPSTDCSAQYLQLRSEPGDRRAYVDVWFDNIAIRPAKGT